MFAVQDNPAGSNAVDSDSDVDEAEKMAASDKYSGA